MNTAPMNAAREEEFGLRIRARLNAGSANLSPDLSERLFEARQRALARHKAPIGGLSLAGAAGFMGRQLFGMDFARPMFAALALITVLMASDYATSLLRASRLEEVDSALLADDLPINAYLDRGFDAWLSSPAQQ